MFMMLCKKGKEEKHNNHSPQTISNVLQTKYLNSEAGIQKNQYFIHLTQKPLDQNHEKQIEYMNQSNI